MSDLHLKVAYEIGDPVKAEVVKAMLESYGVPCAAHGTRIPDLFGLGRTGAGFNLLTGLVKLMVREEDLEAAVALIEQHIDGNGEIEIPEEEWSAGGEEA